MVVPNTLSMVVPNTLSPTHEHAPSMPPPHMSMPPSYRQGCGLVVESHIIDERSEWRTFSDSVSVKLSVGVSAELGVGHWWCGAGDPRGTP